MDNYLQNPEYQKTAEAIVQFLRLDDTDLQTSIQNAMNNNVSFNFEAVDSPALAGEIKFTGPIEWDTKEPGWIFLTIEPVGEIGYNVLWFIVNNEEVRTKIVHFEKANTRIINIHVTQAA